MMMVMMMMMMMKTVDRQYSENRRRSLQETVTGPTRNNVKFIITTTYVLQKYK